MIARRGEQKGKLMKTGGLFVAFVPETQALDGVRAGLGASDAHAKENARYPNEMLGSVRVKTAEKAPRWALLQALASMREELDCPLTGERGLTDRQLLAKLQRVHRHGEQTTVEAQVLMAEAERRAKEMSPGEYVAGFHRKSVWRAQTKLKSLFEAAAPKKLETVVEGTGFGRGHMGMVWVSFCEDVSEATQPADLVLVFSKMPVAAISKGETIFVHREKE